MKNKFNKAITVFSLMAILTFSTRTSTCAEEYVNSSSDSSKIAEQRISVIHEPISEEFIDLQNKLMLNSTNLNDYSDVNISKNCYDDEPIVTYLPIDDEFIHNENVKAIESFHNNAIKNVAENAKGDTAPSSVWNFVVSGDYNGSGNTQYSPIYSNYKFMCNSNKQLHISGSFFVAERQTEDLHIEFINSNDNSITHLYIQPTQLDSSMDPFDTGYYFNFYIGPLNENHEYYLKFNTFSSIFNYFGHNLNYTVSHS